MIGLNLDDFVEYKHTFPFTVWSMPGDGNIMFIARGAEEPFLYAKHYSWQILSQRTLLCDSKGRLGLVIGPVKINRKKRRVIPRDPNDFEVINSIFKRSERERLNPGAGDIIEMQFASNCRGVWSLQGLFYPGKRRLIEITTIRDYKGSLEQGRRMIGATKVCVDGELVKELNYVPE